MTTPATPQHPTPDPQSYLHYSHPAASPTPSNGMGVTGLVTGIIGACLAWVPVLGFLLGVLGVVFGGIGWFYATQGRATNKGMAVAGVVLGIFAVVFWPLLLVVGVGVSAGTGTIGGS